METKYMEIFQNRGRTFKQYTVQFIIQARKTKQGALLRWD